MTTINAMTALLIPEAETQYVAIQAEPCPLGVVSP